MSTWVEPGNKLAFSYKRANFSVTINISIETLWRHAIQLPFCTFYIFRFFQIKLDPLFLARHDQY